MHHRQKYISGYLPHSDFRLFLFPYNFNSL